MLAIMEKILLFFLIGIHALCKAEHTLWGMELQEKEEQKS